MLIALCLIALAARAADPGDLHYSHAAERKAIVAVVESQLATFRASDFDKAYGFAAQGLRQQFTVARFTAMIARGYPLILHNECAEFDLPQDDGTNAVLSVQIFAAGGHSAKYRYTLVRGIRWFNRLWRRQRKRPGYGASAACRWSHRGAATRERLSRCRPARSRALGGT